MITINNLRSLSEFGITIVTGEADALGFRILCDFDDAGARVISEAYGLREDSFQKGWSGGKYSIMLANDDWQTIGIVGLSMRATPIIFITECKIRKDLSYTEIIGIRTQEEYDFCLRKFESGNWVKHKQWGDWKKWLQSPTYSFTSTRNRHLMTGRIT